MGVTNQAFSALRRLGLIILIAIAFLFGLATTVYLSLRSPEVTVPEVVGKDRFEAERILGEADLNFRVRATRASNQVQPNTVLFQLPRAGEVVKTGQTVAMDISRAAKAGEASEVVNDKNASEEKALDNRNTNTSDNKNENENRPKRKPVNKNANENANANANANANVNRPRTITNGENANGTGERANSNASPIRPVNRNDNVKPPAPKPAPTGQNDNRDQR